jgi:hypothetical protein
MIGGAVISNDAANIVADALAPDVPGERIYVDERDDVTLPHTLVSVEAVGPVGAVMYDGTLVVHTWARSYWDASSLAARVVSPLVGFHTLEDGSAYRVKRPFESYLREDDAAHITLRFAIRYDDKV